MKTIHKFTLKAFLGPMIISFLIVMFVLIMNFLWKYIDELVGKGLDGSVIMELLFYMTMNLIPMGLPLSVLFAAIMTMGNLGENYELLAMKSSGMSLPRILSPLSVVVGIIAVGSFFAANNLVPFAARKSQSLLYDISKQKQTLEFKDGVFFDGIENISIRVGHQDPDSKLLTDVMIYDNRNIRGDMTTTIADSGYIKLTDDKKFLSVELFNGNTYEQTRSYKWATESSLRHHIFTKQTGLIPLDGFDFERTESSLFTGSKTKNIVELEHGIDSLKQSAIMATASSYEPFLKEYIFSNHKGLISDSLAMQDSIPRIYQALLTDSVANFSNKEKIKLWEDIKNKVYNSRSILSFDENAAKNALSSLYEYQVEWHRKAALPVSIMIFFLIGAPLGAIIRRGGLGMPIVVSVLFFVLYYMISVMGEKMAKEGTWVAYLGMWFSTLILAPISAFLTYKATYDSNLLNIDWYIIKYKKMVHWLNESVLSRLKKQ